MRWTDESGWSFNKFRMSVFLAALFVCLKSPLAIGANPIETTSEREVLVIVKGVATPFSVFGLIQRLKQIPEVKSVTFDLSQGLADVRFKPGAVVSDEELRRAIRNASYTPGRIRWKQIASSVHAE